MATTTMVDSYARHHLEEEHGEDVQALEGSYVLTGDHPVRIWVVDGNHRPRRVLVTAVVLEDVEADAELLEAVNALNAVTVYGRFFAVNDSVHVEDTVLATSSTPPRCSTRSASCAGQRRLRPPSYVSASVLGGR